MRVLKVGDIVRVIVPHFFGMGGKGKMDVVQEAEYNSSQDEMEYSLFRSGAWYSNDQIKFIRRDRLKTLRRLCRGGEGS